ncbi:DUF2141 domain-containing protein [Cetobacterium ceti]
MKKLFLLIFLLSSSIFGATLQVKVHNKNYSGTVFLAIYNNEADFLKPEKAYKKIKFNLIPNLTTINIENIPEGTYAFTLFLDENNNNKLDTNMFHIPKEPIGFSNNYSPKFKPSYSSAKFIIKNSLEIQNVTLK